MITSPQPQIRGKKFLINENLIYKKYTHLCEIRSTYRYKNRSILFLEVQNNLAGQFVLHVLTQTSTQPPTHTGTKWSEEFDTRKSHWRQEGNLRIS